MKRKKSTPPAGTIEGVDWAGKIGYLAPGLTHDKTIPSRDSRSTHRAYRAPFSLSTNGPSLFVCHEQVSGQGLPQLCSPQRSPLHRIPSGDWSALPLESRTLCRNPLMRKGMGLSWQ